ncbi:hypothetical protein [Pseudoflavitalea rhizosphaerae]|uniref:hypothetical protein n=1 Tax=Pseudoflavitalea rhizosphaerae TaxID=1884793 RepID=UPI000F8EEE72|nr:hypothetical protein [Pseudoflavitalea rhizosphaerae]
MKPPFLDHYPRDYAENIILRGIRLITAKAEKIHDILQYNEAIKNILADKIGVRNLLIEEHAYELTHGFGKCPRIRLNARWLDKWGFQTGNRAKIITMRNLLIITPEEIIKNDLVSDKLPPKRWRL